MTPDPGGLILQSFVPLTTQPAAAQLEALLRARFDPPIQKLVRDARAKLRKLMPASIEMVYSNRNALAIGFASSERRGDWIVSLAVYARGVNLYFVYGVALEDPQGLLQGSGNQGRFVRLESAAMLERPEILALIQGAIREADTPLPKRGRGSVVIKSISEKSADAIRYRKQRTAESVHAPAAIRRGAR